VTDWSLIEDEEIARLVDNMARKLFRTAGSYAVFELDDVRQEAKILVATQPEKALGKLVGGPGLFCEWLYTSLLNVYKADLARAGKNISSELLLEGVEEDE
jgi:hypothetical protein